MMRWREHARGVGGLLRRMMERSEPEQMAEPPRRIDRAGARRMLKSTAAGAERDGTDTEDDEHRGHLHLVGVVAIADPQNGNHR